ncbi:hypothetical protein GA0061098_1023103 [Bradyrhizobium shewense]|uniref:Uncharacterized protein n=1 Tax=Bradyrhizobium shewense TaxID=1761772 RepID=A0A1C3XPG3_9BRAD|nr:hypothetical protein [Bradyrhizobium shewense]SCB54147.1 hypothetical protein GA0061098_1023103 [Bradyrhizobium shewense]
MREETIRFALCETFEQAAIWRALRPGECQSAEAVEHFRRLIATVGQVDDELLLAYAELWEGEADRLAHRELLKALGLDYQPASASEFVARFVAERTGTIPTASP